MAKAAVLGKTTKAVVKNPDELREVMDRVEKERRDKLS